MRDKNAKEFEQIFQKAQEYVSRYFEGKAEISGRGVIWNI